MRAPALWYAPRPTWIARLLAPLGWLYGALTSRRMAGPGTAAPMPVICVGNLVAGGAGKTPTVLALAALLAAMGRRPFALSRGYGGRLTGPVRVANHDPAETGDEPLLLARQLPVIVARDRVAGAALAAREGADCLLLDDGLQNPALLKTLRLAVVDGAAGIGNGLCLPAGPLRAPLAAQLPHVDALLLIGEGEAGARVAALAQAAGKPVHRARLLPDAGVAQRLAGLKVMALAGIGRPEKFCQTLREAGADVIATMSFPDHHAYVEDDVAHILAKAHALAKAHGDDLTVATTQKDWVKLGALWPENEPILVLPVTLVLERPEEMAALLRQALA